MEARQTYSHEKRGSDDYNLKNEHKREEGREGIWEEGRSRRAIKMWFLKSKMRIQFKIRN